MKFIAKILKIALCLVSLSGHAKIIFPQLLDQKDRVLALKFLGSSVSSHMLSSPYPLGGWEGFEIGLSKNHVPTSTLNELGDQTTNQENYEFPLLTFGKGLYNDLDLFLSFVPMGQSNSISHFSTMMRFQFWQSTTFPIRFSGLAHVGTTNLSNQMIVRSYGLSVLGSTTLNLVSLYLGFSRTLYNGRFIGGPKGVTSSGTTEVEAISQLCHLIGTEWPISGFFFAGEVNRCLAPNISFKIGYRL